MKEKFRKNYLYEIIFLIVFVKSWNLILIVILCYLFYFLILLLCQNCTGLTELAQNRCLGRFLKEIIYLLYLFDSISRLLKNILVFLRLWPSDPKITPIEKFMYNLCISIPICKYVLTNLVFTTQIKWLNRFDFYFR